MLNNIWKITFLIFLLSCAEDNPTNSNQDIYPINPDNLDIITWNIEEYPKHSNTNNYLEDIINDLEEIDIIALQEIKSSTSLAELAGLLEGNWEARKFPSSHPDYGELAFLINLETIIFQEPYSILDEYDHYFAYKPPYVLEFSYNNQSFILINIHYKCCGDGELDEQDSWDEEYRRLMASFYLEEYISEYFNNKNVILLGDFNDDLMDAEIDNVFNVFLDSPDEYLFTDFPMAIEENHWDYWSYPSYPSHLDHILISNELFDDYQNTNSSCNTILIDNTLNDGWSEYNNYISDHRPVGISLDISE